MTDEKRRAFTVIGRFAVAPSLDYQAWASDLEMIEYPTNTWISPAITLTEGDEFRCRQGESWDVTFGEKDWNANYVVSADEAGANKKIKLVVTLDRYGAVASGAISIINA